MHPAPGATLVPQFPWTGATRVKAGSQLVSEVEAGLHCTQVLSRSPHAPKAGPALSHRHHATFSGVGLLMLIVASPFCAGLLLG